jgi:hypothetical protein
LEPRLSDAQLALAQVALRNNVKDQTGLAAAGARLVSDTFEVLSVTIWLVDDQKGQLIVAASTAAQAGKTRQLPGGRPIT